MANYRRLISYIYAYEGGIKGKNVGFAKLEVRNGQCKLQVNVRNVYIGSQDTGVFLLCGSDEILVGKIFIRNGAGEFRAIVSVNNVAGSGQSIDKCYGLTVHNLADSWQSYTTIWEDAVTHAAEVVLAEAASEQLEKKEMNSVPVSAITKGKPEHVAETHKNSIADAIEAEIEAQSQKADPVPSSTIQPLETEPPQFLRPSEMEVMEVKPLECVSPIGKQAEETRKEDSTEKKSPDTEIPYRTESREEEDAREQIRRKGHGGEAPEIAEGIKTLSAECGEPTETAEMAAESPSTAVPDCQPEQISQTQTPKPQFSGLHLASRQAPPQEPQAASRPTQPQEPQAASRPTPPQGPQSISRPTQPQESQSTSRPTSPQEPQPSNSSTQPQEPQAASRQTSPQSTNRQALPQGPQSISRPTQPQESQSTSRPTQPQEPQPSNSSTQPQEPQPASRPTQPQEPQLSRPQPSQPSWRQLFSQPRRSQEQPMSQPQAMSQPQPTSRQPQPSPAPEPRTPEFQSAPPQQGWRSQPGWNMPSAGQGTADQGQSAAAAQMEQESGQVNQETGLPLTEQERLEEEPRIDVIWQHFYKTYPKIQAFDYNGGCDILTIKPQDIGLLPREVWGYGNNSFLLHGYYNHRYLIFARLNNQKGNSRFLLGVPGHYYSNEKYMAAMFGFPNFVLSKIQPAGDGRFGYWYTDIRLAH